MPELDFMNLVFRQICFFILLLLSGQLLIGQQADSIIAVNEERIYNNFRYTNNPAVIFNDHIPQYGYASLSVKSESGAFKRPMDPGKMRIFTGSTGGYKKIQRWAVRGEFAYKKQYDFELPWSSVNEGYNGNPFIWADSNKGKWIRDEVSASLQVASPTIERKLYSGLSVDYIIGSGARTNEPKPFYRIRNITLQPGISWQINGRSALGLKGDFGFLQEENEIGQYSIENVLLYRLRGYGTFSRSPMVTGVRKRTGNIIGASLHYEKKNNKYKWVVIMKTNYRSEEVYEGIATRSLTGYYTAYNFEGNALVYKGNALDGTSMLFSGSYASGYADDYLFSAESASHQQAYAFLQWKRWFSTSRGQLWQWKLQPSIHQLSFTDQGTRMHYFATGAECVLSLLWRKKLTDKWSIHISPKAGYMKVVDHRWTNRQMNTVVKDLAMPHYHYISTDYLNTGAAAGAEFRGKGNVCHMLSFNARFHHATFLDEKNNRNINQLQYSILF